MKTSTLLKLFLVGLCGSVLAVPAFARFPAANPQQFINDDNNNQFEEQPLNEDPQAEVYSVEDRIAILERQIKNLEQINTQARVNELQDEIQQLQGKLDEQTHNVELLTAQVRSQIQNITQRLSHATSGVLPAAQDYANQKGKATASTIKRSLNNLSAARNTGSPTANTKEIPVVDLIKEQTAYQSA